MDFVLTWCSALAFYLLLAGQLSAGELAAAVLLATLASGWAHLVRRCGDVRFTRWSDHWRPWGRALAALVPATVRTAAALVRIACGARSAGKADKRPFAFGGPSDPADHARRATAVLAASLAPDSFVVRVEPDRAEALMHAIADTGSSGDARWLI